MLLAMTHRFVNNLRTDGAPTGFFGLINPRVAAAILHERFDALLQWPVTEPAR